MAEATVHLPLHFDGSEPSLPLHCSITIQRQSGNPERFLETVIRVGLVTRYLACPHDRHGIGEEDATDRSVLRTRCRHCSYSASVLLLCCGSPTKVQIQG